MPKLHNVYAGADYTYQKRKVSYNFCDIYKNQFVRLFFERVTK